jgi:CysZ protein
MDTMSRLTERIVTGNVEHAGEEAPFFRQLGFLVKQELPRTILPIVITLILVALGWMTPLGPILTLISPWVAALFLAWDNTDLVPARRLEPFSRRWRSLMATLPFHMGFGALFLLPLANLLFLSFAPVGGALYHIDKAGFDGRPPGEGG